ncbi:hypothetical protein AMAG_13433 [Allomyces macrogynus ATCC 38327]|uniref:Uncharacterized protein n=1 Tax=Allomyces macrogynus (strain ATCC 38327) TaxID=578462 RepID=A0A0L0T243_ALLM3|nr:hypothetical protein AMAG_13433 [Allomyces macrogynus ATCC 38327]|eukprot:KNE68792.1 hypothetical protein AMAG_13433 [Allomyces macrogynus ATCC 38327]
MAANFAEYDQLKAVALAMGPWRSSKLDQLDAHLRELDLTPQRIQYAHFYDSRSSWLDAAMQNPEDLALLANAESVAASSSSSVTAAHPAHSSVLATTAKELAQVTAPSSSELSPGELSLGELVEESVLAPVEEP